MDNTKQLIGNNVRKYRKQKGLKQGELAELVGVEDKTISRIEVGGNYPSFDLLVRIANALDKELVDFVNFSNKTVQAVSQFNKKEIAILKKFVRILGENLK